MDVLNRMKTNLPLKIFLMVHEKKIQWKHHSFEKSPSLGNWKCFNIPEIPMQMNHMDWRICRSIKQSFAWLMTHKWYDNRWTWHFFPPFIPLIVSGSERQQQKSGCSGNKNRVLSIDAHFQFQAYLSVCFRLTQSQLLNYKMILHLPWIREYDCSLFIILSATRQKTNGI